MSTKPKKRAGRNIIIAACALLLVVSVGATIFITMGGSDLLPFMGFSAKAYRAEGSVQGMVVPAVGDEGDSMEALQAYYDKVANFAVANGINTLIYQGKSGLPVYWRDNAFPLPQNITAQDGLMEKIDPLRLFCDAVKGKDIQVWVSVDAYSTEGYTSGMTGQVAKLVAGEAGAGSVPISPAKQEYTEMLVRSLSRLPHKYPIAGLVFTGLDYTEVTAPADLDMWGAHFTEMLGQIDALWQRNKLDTNMALAFSGQASAEITRGLNSALADLPMISHITPAIVTALSSSGVVDYFLPALTGGRQYASDFSDWSMLGGKTLAIQPQGFSDSMLFLACLAPSFGGTILGSYSEVAVLEPQLGALRSILNTPDGSLPDGFSIPQKLQVTYPSQGATVYSSTVFVMGTSMPNEPLYIDGVEIGGRGEGGTFGVAVDLKEGENKFLFTQKTASFELILKHPAPSGGGTTPEPIVDSTKNAPEGQAVRVITPIASALSDPANTSSIKSTFYKGATGVVQKSVQTKRSDESGTFLTYYYQLTSGDYVWAGNCEWIDGGTAAYTGLEAAPETLGERIHFSGEGAAAAYVRTENGQIQITMHNTTFSLPEGFSSQYVKSASLSEAGENGVTLTLQLEEDMVWGYSLEYDGSKTSLFIKRTPVRSDNNLMPLQGVRIMLDPGHGGSDFGAYGLMGETGPNEKDVNLKLSQAIAYRLRQLGAEVLMTRTDDTFYSLEQRLEMEIAEKPDFFISVHHNSVPLTSDRNAAKGVEAYYFNEGGLAPSVRLAQSLQDNIVTATGRLDRGVFQKAFYVTRTDVCPSILYEYGFMVNPDEFYDITSSEGIYAAACGTASGILAMLPVIAPPAPGEQDSSSL